MMVSDRRRGSEDSLTRTRLLDAAEDLLRTEGYSAVTVRALAAHADLKRQIVHYYFRSMEELFLAVVKRSCERFRERQEAALAADNPLRALWNLASKAEGIVLEIEFNSIANHYPSVREELGSYFVESRARQVEGVKARIDHVLIDGEAVDSEVIVTMVRGIARSLVMESNLGSEQGHKATTTLVERYLKAFDPVGA